MENRNNLISFLQVWGILLVVIGHSNICLPDPNPVVRQWLYTFHMPLFIFISGYLLQYTLFRKKSSICIMVESSYGAFVLQKAKRLLLPYVFISSMVFLPKVYLSFYAIRPVDASFSEYIRMLVYPWDNVISIYWFLPTLFLVILIVITSVYIFTKWRIAPLVLGVIFLLFHVFNPAKGIEFLNLEGVIFYLFYFYIGIYYCLHQTKWDALLRSNTIQTLMLSFGVSVILLYFRIPGELDTIMDRCLEVCQAINGIVMSISFGYLYLRKNWHFFHHLFGASAAIYLFSWFPQVVSQQVLSRLIPVSWMITTPLAIVTGIYVPLAIYKFLRYVSSHFKYGKYIALLFGQ